jgi:hypothetical protein
VSGNERDAILGALESGASVQRTPDGVKISEPNHLPDPGDRTVAQPALDANGEPWLFVEALDDPDFEFDLEVGYSDVFAHEHDRAIDESLEFLRSLPDVRSAFRQDPEEILVLGTRDAQRIQDELLVWWSERL